MILILLYTLKFELFQFLAEIAKKEEEAKEQSQKLNISQNSNHKTASKSTSKSGDFFIIKQECLINGWVFTVLDLDFIVKAFLMLRKKA